MEVDMIYAIQYIGSYGDREKGTKEKRRGREGCFTKVVKQGRREGEGSQ
jgi:hypothetical protein